MCMGCWFDAGAPRMMSPAIIEAARLAILADVYGGFLGHCVFQDMNCRDQDVAISPDDIRKAEEAGQSMESIAYDLIALLALQRLTEPERYSAMALSEGYIDEHGQYAEGVEDRLIELTEALA